MKLRLSNRALGELTTIAEYFDERKPVARERIRKAINESLARLLTFPHSGRPLKIEGLRKYVTQPYSYIIYYMAHPQTDELFVVSICYPARQRNLEDK